MKGALNNDLVSFKVLGSSVTEFGQRHEGEVLRIIERFKNRFVAEVISSTRSRLQLFFDDPQLSGLREVWGYFPSFRRGDKVLIQLSKFPPERMEGEVIRVLGNINSGRVDFFSIISDLKLPGKFKDENCWREIEKLTKFRERVLEKNLELYKNLKDKPFFTIDGVNAKDFDDSICCERKDKDFLVYIAIADVWGFLNCCTHLFLEAKKRGTSIYLIDKVIPMLPPILSEELCSLVEGKKRHTLCVVVEISQAGEIRESTFQIFPATIISKKRFNYQEVNELLSNYEKEENQSTNYSEIERTVILSNKIAKLLQEKKRDNNKQPLKIFQDKFELELNRQEEVIKITKDCLSNTQSQLLVETFMIMANNLVANFLEREEIPTIYRTHRSPELERLHIFSDEVKELGCNCLIPSTDLISVNFLNSILEDLRNNKNFKIIQYNLLQAMPKAEYRTENIGHFGINLSNYVHFTSPIRRLPDLLIHRSIWMFYFLKDKYSKVEKEAYLSELRELAYISNLTEQRSVIAEKRYSSRKIYKYLLSKQENDEFEGIVTSRSPWGYTVLINQIYDGFVKTSERRLLGQKVKLRKVEFSWDEFIEC